MELYNRLLIFAGLVETAVKFSMYHFEITLIIHQQISKIFARYHACVGPQMIMKYLSRIWESKVVVMALNPMRGYLRRPEK